MVTSASALYSLSSGGAFRSVERSVDGDVFGASILLPEPVKHGLDEYSATGPVSFYVEAGYTPTVLLEGQFVIPTSNTAHASVVGYLVPAT